jgi:hypothetical protein
MHVRMTSAIAGCGTAALLFGCARDAATTAVAVPSATGNATAAAATRIGPTIEAALAMHLLTPSPEHRVSIHVRTVRRSEIRGQVDTAERLLARTERSDTSWYDDDRAILARANAVAHRAQLAGDAVARDVMTDLVQGEDFLYDSAAAASCSRPDATQYLHAARSYIDMAARNLTEEKPNPIDWRAPVPEVHAEEDTGCVR